MDLSASSLCKPPICESAEREHMFEKVVTPSDVGKLNRLVIPKQHAEKYFPLDSAAGEKGLLLNFDETGGSGKSWRFRYSYWSSSQSYVITKGWSRFVKEKQLFAGDVVSFLRDSADGRLFIAWRRSPAERSQLHHGISLHRSIHPNHLHHPSWGYSSVTPALSVPPPLLVGPHPYSYGYGVISPNYSCLHSQVGAGAGPTLFETLPVAKEKAAASKRLRLFGVNMDCHVTSKNQENDCDVLLSATHHEVGVVNSQILASAASSSAALQLRLQSGDLSSSPAATSKIAGFLDKGKSSLTLDFGV